MAPVKPNLIGIFDILAGILLLYTESAVPTGFAKAHAGFLIFKGGMSQLPLEGVQGVMPILILGSAADVISAAIIFTGTPPILAGYKEIIAIVLLQKGLFGLLSMLSY
ncbi:MAG: hypothetical protein ACI8Z7_000901 [Candidatus Nanohaloarchaea archaeon]|jgi:hypothetical protein